MNELPGELTRMDEKIAVEKESVELALAEWKGLESQNNTLEKDILSMNELIAKQKNRQLEVKKNEEYQALENEISNLQAKIEERENEQIEILLKIDGARKPLRSQERLLNGSRNWKIRGMNGQSREKKKNRSLMI